jgi:F-type H+-transporting ATPase subunit epsilon
VRLPGSEGSFGVLRGHAPLDRALEAGAVEIIDAEGLHQHYGHWRRLLSVADDVAMVLADSAEFAQDINADRARESETRAATV